jgi:uncharacterized protein involved in outer membrane biogenesis
MAKTVLIGIGGLVLLLVAAILIVPSFIDWNGYKGEIAAQAKAATGRELSIGGDIRLAVLPAPALVANDVVLKNLAGAAAPNMVKLKTLEVRVAFGPLLKGDIEVDSIRLIEPLVELEVLADGRKNWDFSTAPSAPAPATASRPAAPAAQRQESGRLPNLRLDSLVIDRGLVTYRDSRAGTVEYLDNINAKASVGSLMGPFESSGRMTVHGIPVKFDAAVAKLSDASTAPFSLTLDVQPGSFKGQINGTVTSLDGDPVVKAKAKIEGKDVATLLVAAQGASGGAAGAQPGVLGQALTLDSEIEASAKAVQVKSLALRLGDIQAGGTANLDLGQKLSLIAKLTVPQVNADALMAMAPVTRKVEPAAVDGTDGRAMAPAPARPAPEPQPGTETFVLPADLNGAVSLTVEAVTFKGDIIRDLRLNADLGGGAITVSQLSALFPGSSDLFVSGFVTADKGKPKFEGGVELTVNDTRGVMRWLGSPLPAELPSDRLRKVTYKSGLALTGEQAQITGIDLRLDNSHVSGGVTVAFRQRPAFGADLTVDRFNLDGYMNLGGGASGSAASSAPAASQAKPASSDANPASGVAGALSNLNSFDANVRLQMGELSLNRTPIKTVNVDATLYNGALQVRRLSVADLAGLSATLGGGIKGLNAIPSFDKLSVSAKSADIGRLFRFLGQTPPVNPAGLGAVALEAKVDGGLMAPTLDLDLRAAGAKLAAKGKMDLLTLTPNGEFALRLGHGDLGQLLAALEIPYRPSQKIGPIDLSTNAKAGLTGVTLDAISGKLGATTVAGAAAATWTGTKPFVTADLRLGDLAIDAFLPAQRRASVEPSGRPGIVPVAWPAPAVGKAPSQATDAALDKRWSTEPMDLSALGAVDADIKAKATSVVYDVYRLQNVDLAATLKDGLLKTDHLTGLLYGGPVKVDAEVASANRATLQANVSATGVDLAQLVRATGGGGASGTMELAAVVESKGGSMADLVSALNGHGNVAMKKVEVAGGAQGSALAGILGIVGSLNQLGGLTGGRTGQGADLTGSFKIDKGVVRSDDLKLVSGLGNGAVTATVDLPQWLIDAAGEVHLTQNVLTAILSQRVKLPERVPVKVTGKLDAPVVKIDTGSASQAPSRSQQQQQPPAQQQQQQRPRAEDLLRGLLGR